MIAISGGMVASFALPATAVTLTPKGTPMLSATQALGAPASAPAPLVSRSFGMIGFTGVDKPPPVVAPVVREPAIDRVSRSATRAPVSAPTQDAPEPSPAPEAPAPEPEAPAPAPEAPAPAPEPPAAAPASSSGDVLDIAAGLAGIDYVYGGTTTAGFDCSGFTQYVFGKVGIDLPRTAEDQRQFAKTVSNPKPGDLVFFGAPAHHMGIYAGDGMIWDSPRTGKSVSKRALWTTDVTYGRV